MLPVWIEFVPYEITFANVVVMVLYSLFFSAYITSILPSKGFLRLKYRIIFATMFLIFSAVMGGVYNIRFHVEIPGLEGSFMFCDGSFGAYFWRHSWFFMSIYGIHFLWEGDVE